MPIKVILAKAHQTQIENVEVQTVLNEIEEGLNKVNLPYQDNTINYIFVEGRYIHNERKMIITCLFVNKMEKPITEIHGVLRLKFNSKDALIAKTTIDFDKAFIGSLDFDEAILVNIGVPVKGLSKDENFIISDVSGRFDDVRVTMD